MRRSIPYLALISATSCIAIWPVEDENDDQVGNAGGNAGGTFSGTGNASNPVGGDSYGGSSTGGAGDQSMGGTAGKVSSGATGGGDTNGSSGTNSGGNVNATGGDVGVGGDGTGGEGGDNPLAEKRSAGCGTAPGQTGTDWVRYTMITQGKNVFGGAWTYEREYFIKLPVGYDNTRAYPVILQGPGCGGGGRGVYGFGDPRNDAIRVGVSPITQAQGGNQVPSNGCFDDKAGDDSVEWIFYEQLFDQLASTLCIDEHRVFATGNDSGSFWANELACIYGSDPDHPIRGIASNAGGLPVGNEAPTCSDGKFAGIWMHDVQDNANPFSGTRTAILRALRVNECTGDFEGPREPYPVPNTDICQKFTGCPAEYPVVLCTVTGTNHSDNAGIANIAFPQFLMTL